MRVGILGGGQLGRMLALAGHPLGFSFVVLDPAAEAPAAAVADHIRAEYDDPAALDQLAGVTDCVTYEFENVPVSAARRLSKRVAVAPPSAALEAAQDRLAEKRLFESLDIPTAAFAPVSAEAELREALARLATPAVLKTRRMGYDGKGQARLSTPADAAAAWAEVGGVPSIVEESVPFERELSVVAAAAPDGARAVYPLVENRHEDGILRVSLAPAPHLGPDLQRVAEEYVDRLCTALDYVGIIAVELFEVRGKLLANEMAPRVHNSGHWTIEGAVTSQFENHLRAVTALPLGDPSPVGLSAMVNLIGAVPAAGAAMAVRGLHVHLYGKAPRPGRKLGHMTMVAASEDDRAQALERMIRLAAGTTPSRSSVGAERT